MLVVCRKCKNTRQSYVRHLCKLCYEALKKQEYRGSPIFDPQMLYPPMCGKKDCNKFATEIPGKLTLCEYHYDLFYGGPPPFGCVSS